MKRIVLSGIIAGALALASFGAVGAAPLAAQPAVEQAAARPGRGLLAAAAALIRATADVTGLTQREVLGALKGGKSLAQIAQEHGKTADQVIASARAAIKQRLDQAVAAQKITRERADQQLAAFDAAAPQAMQNTQLGRGRGASQARPGRVAAARVLIKATADVTGLTQREVLGALKGGKSLAQIAQEHGKTADDILARARELLQDREQELLDRLRDLINQPGLRTPQSPAPAPAPTS